MTVEFFLLLLGTGVVTGVTIGWAQPAAERWSHRHDKDM